MIDLEKFKKWSETETYPPIMEHELKAIIHALETSMTALRTCSRFGSQVAKNALDEIERVLK